MVKKQYELQVKTVKANLTLKEHRDMHLRMDKELVTAEATYIRRLILRDIQDGL